MQYADAVTTHSALYCHFYARELQLLADGEMHVLARIHRRETGGGGRRREEGSGEALTRT